MSNQPHPSCLYRQASGGELILHLLGRAEAELAGRRNLDGLACPRVAALTRRAVFDLELTKAQQTDLFAFLRRPRRCRQKPRRPPSWQWGHPNPQPSPRDQSVQKFSICSSSTLTLSGKDHTRAGMSPDWREGRASVYYDRAKLSSTSSSAPPARVATVRRYGAILVAALEEDLAKKVLRCSNRYACCTPSKRTLAPADAFRRPAFLDVSSLTFGGAAVGYGA